MKSGGKNDREVQLKIKETYLINSLKKELKELQNMSKCKTADIENMKNLIKSSKFNETQFLLNWSIFLYNYITKASIVNIYYLLFNLEY